ncbi:hypothetical protein HXX76_008653 [Chlamydomonas incerta]|uniref:Uncharacterized protein n=1 Tax=Chlamydomonas incerta TaxID=51695 RepID=A0A835STP0_CHLIN|nr:hypothetical protein HXX76_008653 [Chlamydomonas incerta]|eukprot:KAG2432923.1 hypothetical protein HXX76_008653 [Chlamydomonas incerta]
MLAGRLAWASFTYCYFLGTNDLAGLPAKKPRGGGCGGKAAAAKGKAKSKAKGKGAPKGRGAAAAAAAAADGAGVGDGSEEDAAAGEDALLEMPPVAEQAYEWLLRLVGKRGWHPDGEVSLAFKDWVKRTREWLDAGLGEDWTKQHAAEAEARHVSKTKSLKSQDADKPFFPIYPYHVNSGRDNRVKCSLTSVRKKGKQQQSATAAAAGADEDAKSEQARMERSFPTGCCGLPAEYGQATNCTLGFLVMSDVCEALIQAAEGWDKLPNSGALQAFLYRHVLQHKAGAKEREAVKANDLASGYPQLLASCVEGWERALTHVHRVWLPVAMQAYLDVTSSAPEDLDAPKGGSSAANAGTSTGAGASGSAAGPSGSGSCPRLTRPQHVPKPQLLLPCCIPPEEVLARAEMAQKLAEEQSARARTEYEVRVKQEQEEQEERSPGPVSPRLREDAQSQPRLAAAAGAPAPAPAPAGLLGAPLVPMLAARLPGQAGCGAAAAASGLPDAEHLPQPHPQQQQAQPHTGSAMDMDIDGPHDPGLVRRLQDVRLGSPGAAAPAVGAAGAGAAAGRTTGPGAEPVLGLVERLRVALVHDTELRRQQAGVGAAADEEALAEALASLERAIEARKAVMRVHG